VWWGATQGKFGEKLFHLLKAKQGPGGPPNPKLKKAKKEPQHYVGGADESDENREVKKFSDFNGGWYDKGACFRY